MYLQDLKLHTGDIHTVRRAKRAEVHVGPLATAGSMHSMDAHDAIQERFTHERNVATAKAHGLPITKGYVLMKEGALFGTCHTHSPFTFCHGSSPP